MDVLQLSVSMQCVLKSPKSSANFSYRQFWEILESKWPLGTSAFPLLFDRTLQRLSANSPSAMLLNWNIVCPKLYRLIERSIRLENLEGWNAGRRNRSRLRQVWMHFPWKVQKKHWLNPLWIFFSEGFVPLVRVLRGDLWYLVHLPLFSRHIPIVMPCPHLPAFLSKTRNSNLYPPPHTHK